MAGSHRAEKAPRKARNKARNKTPGLRVPAWALGAVAVLVILVGAWFGTQAWLGADPASSPTATGTPSGDRSTTPTPSTSPSTSAPASPTPTPKPTPTTPANLTKFPADQPRRLTIPGILESGFDEAITNDGQRLKAASATEVSRWSDRGSPGSPGQDTVVMIGVSNSDPESAFYAINSVKPGSKVRIRTDRGVLTYTVTDIHETRSARLLADPAIKARRPGRLVLVAERYAPSADRLTNDLVVVAVLTGAKPA